MMLSRLNKTIRRLKSNSPNLFLDKKALLSQERERFNKYGWDEESALLKLNTVLQLIEQDDYEDSVSRHGLLFSAISMCEKVSSILEIGTYKGESTILLSHIFPQAKILTIDLPSDDVVFQNTYGGSRGTPTRLSTYMDTRNRNIDRKNIQAIEGNSFFLPSLCNKSYDLIWVDGGHLFPDVSWDICNAYNSCNVGGHILIDDVFEKGVDLKTDKASSDSRKLLDSLKSREGIDVDYFLKRTNEKLIERRVSRKYIGVIRKQEMKRLVGA